MVKVGAALLTAVVLLLAGFVVVPKLLLKAPGTNVASNNTSVPIGRAHPLGEATSAANAARAATPAALRLQAFDQIQANAGFRPLTPASLPASYQLWERYLRAGDRPAVVFSYRKPDNLFLFVVERKVDPNAPPGFQRGDFVPAPRQGGPPGSRPSGSPSAAARQSPRVTVGTSNGIYTQGLTTTAMNALGDALPGDLARHSQLHSVLFNRGDLEITVVADLNDVSRDQLIQIGAELR